jgi:hypothetical protein
MAVLPFDERLEMQLNRGCLADCLSTRERSTMSPVRNPDALMGSQDRRIRTTIEKYHGCRYNVTCDTFVLWPRYRGHL